MVLRSIARALVILGGMAAGALILSFLPLIGPLAVVFHPQSVAVLPAGALLLFLPDSVARMFPAFSIALGVPFGGMFTLWAALQVIPLKNRVSGAWPFGVLGFLFGTLFGYTLLAAITELSLQTVGGVKGELGAVVVVCAAGAPGAMLGAYVGWKLAVQWATAVPKPKSHGQ